MKHLLFALAILTQPAIAQDHLYVYGERGNDNYQCESYLTYIDTDGDSSVTMTDCQYTGSDYNNWPVFRAQPIRVTLYGPAFKRTIFKHCQFVAHAMAVNRTTSTVVDCR